MIASVKLGQFRRIPGLKFWFCSAASASIVHFPAAGCLSINTSESNYQIRSTKRSFSSSPLLNKIRKGQGRNRNVQSAISSAFVDEKEKGKGRDEDDENDDEDGEGPTKSGTPHLDALKELETYYSILIENLDKHLTLKVNLKLYEDIPVTLPNGETHRLSKMARISMKNPTMVSINFTDHPEAIKQAKDALQKMELNAQQDGIVLHVPVPKITRERREELANHYSKLYLNEYRLALNQVYQRYSKRIEQWTKNIDMKNRLTSGLLAQKRKFDKMGEDKIEERKKLLLKEVVG